MGQGTKDEDEPSDAEIVAMTIRHGADHTRRYLDAIARPEFYEEADRLGSFAADLPKEPEAEVIPFPPAREPKP